MKSFLPALCLLLPFVETVVCSAEDPFEAWTGAVQISEVSPAPGRHAFHSYYLANPESPDGKHVLFYTSAVASGHVGEIRIRERSTGRETVLATDVHTEDAHRAACQQWLSGGRKVAFHEVVDKVWRVVVVDVASLEKTVVAQNHQLGFGRPDADLLPLYGPHWNPGPHRDLEIWDATSGKTSTFAKISEVESKYGEWLAREFSGKACSIFFPVLSPDLKRVFFKIAAGSGGEDFMAKGASQRQGIVCYDFAKAACIWQRDKWGHPGWMPDSRRIFEMGNLILNTDEDAQVSTRLKDVPYLRGSHPSVSPDGRLMVTDGQTDAAGGSAGDWGVMVADMGGTRWKVLHHFKQDKGANSWRRNHPHPAFSADGMRIYYNTNEGEFTRLMVAQRAPGPLPAPGK